jgi:arylsulfatase A-like enzyme
MRVPAEGGGAGRGGWHEATLTAEGGAESCRLHLVAEGPSDALGGAVWAVPKVVVAADDDATMDARNLIVISLDTLRADHLSGYGYRRATSPRMDRWFVEQGTTFANASTTYPMTHIAHMSMFTGLYPAALREQGLLLPRSSPVRTLAEVLRDGGFETAAITEDGLVSGARGFWFGFERFVERTAMGSARETFADGRRFVQAHRHRKFFLFLHTYQTHGPYEPSAAYATYFSAGDAGEGSHDSSVDEAYRASMDDYDREIRETDDIVASFLEELDRLNLTARSYVVLVSDHGEAFGEHGLEGHGWGPHQEQLHVPLMVRGPGIPVGRVISEPVSLVDLTPTLVDLLGLPGLEQAQGVSLMEALRGGSVSTARPHYFQWMGGKSPQGVRFGQWKYVRRRPGGPGRLYDLERDPGEERPVQDHPAVTDHAAKLLDAYEADGARRAEALRAGDGAPPRYVMPRGVREALEALGYIR